ncbi:MAG: RNase H1/viroplasmin domain-containing protein [Candidatus Rokubacteria bacterium]|nr:RNase H1/viroplasmin domain-containing protein [Candidatus Rokubacteria bacterium]
MARASKVYVVTAPERIRGIYTSWADCEAAVKGVSGARYQGVSSRAQAEAMLRGEGGALEPGLWAFVDGNHLGGVGVVIVEKTNAAQATVVEEGGYTVMEVLAGAGIPRLGSRAKITEALARLRNVLSELAALYLALKLVPAGATVSVVHDYEGVGAWMEGRWKTKDVVVAALVAACRALAGERGLTARYRHQRGHQSSWAGRDDFAHYNAEADALATQAGDRFG